MSETHLQVLNQNSVEYDSIVRQATGFVRGHLGDVREWYDVPRDDADYFNPETGRGASDDDILDNVRSLIMDDLLNDERNDHVAAESLSDAASHAVHEYVLAEKMRSF